MDAGTKFPQGLKRLRKNTKHWAKLQNQAIAGAKAQATWGHRSARLKVVPCYKTRTVFHEISRAKGPAQTRLKSCPVTKPRRALRRTALPEDIYLWSSLSRMRLASKLTIFHFPCSLRT